MVDVRGRWAFITGASRGLGKLSARFLAERGCNLIVHGRRLSHLEPLVLELKNFGVEVLPVEAEFTDLDQVEKMLRTIDSLLVNVDIVLNNAGFQIAYREDYYKTPAEDLTVSFLVNTTAPHDDLLSLFAPDGKKGIRKDRKYDKRHRQGAGAGRILCRESCFG